MTKIKIELNDETDVYVVRTMSQGFTHSIELESENVELSIHGTKDQIFKFATDLQESLSKIR